MRKKKATTKKQSLKQRNTKKTSLTLNKDSVDIAALYKQVHKILLEAKKRASHKINAEMVRAYWLVGQAIVEYEQKGKHRADYGKRVIETLAERLVKESGNNGFSSRNLWWMKEFYLKFPILNALRSELSWTHYRLLLKVEKQDAQSFYEQEAAEENWSTRELERQISTLFYERIALSKEKHKMLVQGHKKAEKYSPEDFIKDPSILEFLGLKDSFNLSESKLESLLLLHLKEFMLELGKGFCFVQRQQRITIDGDHFYIDLVFYNRLLRCFVLIDLKMGKLTHQDMGQMQLYVNYYTEEMTEEWENPPIGILLCADKNDAVVRYTLSKEQHQIFTTQFKLYLPTEEELTSELRREQTMISMYKKLQKDRKLPSKSKNKKLKS